MPIICYKEWQIMFGLQLMLVTLHKSFTFSVYQDR